MPTALLATSCPNLEGILRGDGNDSGEFERLEATIGSEHESRDEDYSDLCWAFHLS